MFTSVIAYYFNSTLQKYFIWLVPANVLPKKCILLTCFKETRICVDSIKISPNAAIKLFVVFIIL